MMPWPASSTVSSRLSLMRPPRAGSVGCAPHSHRQREHRIPVPPALSVRIARMLATAADHTDNADSATDPGGVSWAREAVLVTGAVGAVWVCGVVWVIEHRHETVTGYGTRLRGVEEGKGAS